jgi:hypothetical protein
LLSKRKEKKVIELGFYFSFFLFEKYHILLEKQNDWFKSLGLSKTYPNILEKRPIYIDFCKKIKDEAGFKKA